MERGRAPADHAQNPSASARLDLRVLALALGARRYGCVCGPASAAVPLPNDRDDVPVCDLQPSPRVARGPRSAESQTGDGPAPAHDCGGVRLIGPSPGFVDTKLTV